MEENKDKFLEEVKKAAEEGAKKGSKRNLDYLSIIKIVLVVLVIGYGINKLNNIQNSFNQIFSFESDVEGHDLTLNNKKIFGYTVSDFEEAVLADSTKLKKIEVYKQDITEMETTTSTGLFNWSVFTKSQIVTYNGSVNYVVDLSKLSKDSLSLDDENKIVKMLIPHAEQNEINIPADKILFGDVNKGILAFGDLKITQEDAAKIQAQAQNAMQAKLDEMKVNETADKFAKLVVWELYSPIIKSVSPNYSLVVEFK